MSRQRVCGPDRVGQAGARDDVRSPQARYQIVQEWFLATLQMRGTGYVDQEAVGRIERDIRAVAAHGPRRQSLKRGGVSSQIARCDVQTGNPRLYLGEPQA